MDVEIIHVKMEGRVLKKLMEQYVVPVLLAIMETYVNIVSLYLILIFVQVRSQI